jgi:hypothetical protein
VSGRGAEPAPPFGAPSLDQLTGLVFELASQLHAERVRRIALEAALEEAGVRAETACERLALQLEVRGRSVAALDRAMSGLMRVMTEDVDPRTPLRTRKI